MDAGNLLDKVSDNLSVHRAFGAAYEKDGAAARQRLDPPAPGSEARP